jgi:beta-lactamase regulating signal transducer with metallopeptidase domain
MTTLALLTLRTSVVLFAALAACVACRRHSAALRHMLLAAGVGAALLVAPLMALLPSWDVLPRPVATWSSSTSGSEMSPGDRLASGSPAGSSVPLVPTVPNAADSGAGALSVTRVVLGIWLAGALVGLGVLLVGLLRLARFSVTAAPVTDARWLSLTGSVARELELSRPVRLLSAPEAAICTWGVWRSAVVVPDHAIEWSDERVRTVLCHELAHVSRGDWGTQIAASLLRSAFWFNPLTWMVHRRLRDEAERACDDAVLRLGMPESVYAGHLLDIARGTRRRTFAFAAAMSMARSSTLEGRVVAMLNTNASRNVPSRAARAAIVTVLMAVACGVAALGLSAQSGPLSLHGSIYDSTGAV